MDQIHSSCKECCFAIYDGNTQTGCELNRLDVFRNNKVEIIEAYDKEKEFYVVNGRLCMHRRGPKWILKYKDNIVGQLNQELKLPYQVIFNITNIEEIEQICKKILSLDRKPLHITAVRAISNQTKPSDIKNILNTLDIKWRLQLLTEEMYDSELLHYTFTSVKCPYVMYIKDITKFNLPNDFLSKLEKRIYDEFFVFSCLTDDNTFIFPHLMFHTYGGLETLDEQQYDLNFNKCQPKEISHQ